jgi:hypothetical protein
MRRPAVLVCIRCGTLPEETTSDFTNEKIFPPKIRCPIAHRRRKFYLRLVARIAGKDFAKDV